LNGSGPLSCSPSWDKPLFESGFEKRRLKLLNSLAAGLAKIGARLNVQGKEARELSITVGNTGIELAFDHPEAKANRQGQWQTRPGPADILRLTIGKGEAAPDYKSVWQDADQAKLESRLTDIVIEIVTAGEAEYRASCFRHHEWLLKRRKELEVEVLRRREEAERKEREHRAAEAKARRDHLLAQAQAWRTAQDIRGFVASVLAAGEVQGDGKSDVSAWADWALSEADALDPAKQGGLAIPDSAPVRKSST